LDHRWENKDDDEEEVEKETYAKGFIEKEED
jgi:hypothetical protein